MYLFLELKEHINSLCAKWNVSWCYSRWPIHRPSREGLS